MPKFFINFRAGNKTAKDVVGVYLPRLYQARIEALVSARELMAENVNGSQAPLETIIITDERGQQLLTIPAEEVLAESTAPLSKRREPPGEAVQATLGPT
jgi:hypothetical protein